MKGLHDIKTILDSVLEEIRPNHSDREREEEIIKYCFKVLREIIKRRGLKITPLMVGSIAKDTDLRYDKDIDIFLLFEKKVTRQILEHEGLGIGKEFFKTLKSKAEINYAEHPYTKGMFKGFSIEIVPCYRIKNGGKIQSAVDRSPLHTAFVIDELRKRPTLRDEIRLLKQFMKANGIYGANAAVEGFSGYLCELLVIKYASLMKVLNAASGWKRGEFLTLGRRSRRDKFPEAPLVFIDPVDANRNVAAAVSVDMMARFSNLSKEFLKEQSKEHFFKKPKKVMKKQDFVNKLKHRQSEIVGILFKVPELLEDTLLPQLEKSLNALVRECEKEGFRILKKGKWTDGKEAVFVLEFDVWWMPKVEKKIGPSFDSKQVDIDGFIAKNLKNALSRPYIEDGRWTIDVRRAHLEVMDFLKEFMNDPYGFGKNLKDIKKFRIYSNGKLKKISNTGFWEFMGEFWS